MESGEGRLVLTHVAIVLVVKPEQNPVLLIAMVIWMGLRPWIIAVIVLGEKPIKNLARKIVPKFGVARLEKMIAANVIPVLATIILHASKTVLRLGGGRLLLTNAVFATMK